MISFRVIVLRSLLKTSQFATKKSQMYVLLYYIEGWGYADNQTDARLGLFFRLYMCLHTCCGSCQPSSMFPSATTLIIHSKNFKGIVCGWLESSEGVSMICDWNHSPSISLHHKPSDSISVIDFIWCRVPPGDSDGGSIAAGYSNAQRWASGN